MKKTLLTPLFAVLASLAFAQTKVTVDDLLTKGKAHNDKVVVLTGKVVEFQAKTSKKGNKYTTFQIAGKSPKQVVNVYLRGHLDAALKIGDGKMVTVTGVYRVEKKLGNSTFKNEIVATAVKGKPHGVKPAATVAKS